MNSHTSWWQDLPDDRELARLEVVGLAAEVATLAARIDEALHGTPGLRTGTVGVLRQALSSRATAVLAHRTGLKRVSSEALRLVASFLREDRRQILQLRSEVDELIDLPGR